MTTTFEDATNNFPRSHVAFLKYAALNSDERAHKFLGAAAVALLVCGLINGLQDADAQHISYRLQPSRVLLPPPIPGSCQQVPSLLVTSLVYGSPNGGAALAVPTGTWNAQRHLVRMRGMYGSQLIAPAHAQVLFDEDCHPHLDNLTRGPLQSVYSAVVTTDSTRSKRKVRSLDVASDPSHRYRAARRTVKRVSMRHGPS